VRPWNQVVQPACAAWTRPHGPTRWGWLSLVVLALLSLANAALAVVNLLDRDVLGAVGPGCTAVFALIVVIREVRTRRLRADHTETPWGVTPPPALRHDRP
jgi:hypothetical protein